MNSLLRVVNRILTEEPELSAALDRIAELLYRRRQYFWVGIYTWNGAELERQVHRGPEPPCRTFKLGQGNVGTVVLTGKPKLVQDVRQDETYQMCFVETRSELCVPIMGHEGFLGVIDAESDRLAGFQAEDQELLSQVAAALAEAIEAQACPPEVAGAPKLLRRSGSALRRALTPKEGG